MAGRQKYTTTEIAEALEIMDSHNGSIMATHKETGISRTTLKRWREKHYQGIAIRASKRVEQKITETYENIHEVALIEEGKLEEKAISAKKIILDRIMEIAPQEKNMDRLTNALKLMHTITTSEDPDEAKEKDITIYQQVANQLNQYGKKD